MVDPRIAETKIRVQTAIIFVSSGRSPPRGPKMDEVKSAMTTVKKPFFPENFLRLGCYSPNHRAFSMTGRKLKKRSGV